jgi:hypothetical protein
MGGDDSQKLLPRRGVHSSPGRKPPAQLTKSTISLILAVGLSRGAPWTLGLWPQLQPAWVIFGKHRWVNSGARRRVARSQFVRSRLLRTESPATVPWTQIGHEHRRYCLPFERWGHGLSFFGPNPLLR